MSFYPETRYKYSYAVGECAENFVKRVIKAIGRSEGVRLKVYPHKVTDSGTDITIKNLETGELSKIEVLNLHKNSYIDLKRAESIRANLSYTKYSLVLIFGFNRLTREARKILKNIKRISFPDQIIPKEYKQYFSVRGLMFRRKLADRKLFRELKDFLTRLFKDSGFIGVMYSVLGMFVNCGVNSLVKVVGCGVVDGSSMSFGTYGHVNEPIPTTKTRTVNN